MVHSMKGHYYYVIIVKMWNQIKETKVEKKKRKEKHLKWNLYIASLKCSLKPSVVNKSGHCAKRK